jgi:hypothetical protein
MESPSPRQVIQWLHAWTEDNHQALKQLFPLVHEKVHRLVHRYRAREKPGHNFPTTALVNKVFQRGEKSMLSSPRAHAA